MDQLHGCFDSNLLLTNIICKDLLKRIPCRGFSTPMFVLCWVQHCMLPDIISTIASQDIHHLEQVIGSDSYNFEVTEMSQKCEKI